MSHVLNFERRGAYLAAAVTGDNTPQDVQEYLAEVRKACLTHGCARVLIEENLRGPSLGTMVIYDIVALGSKNAAPAVRKIAFLNINPEHDRKDMVFAENVAVNRALDVRFFTDRREAEQWLAP